MTSLYNNTDWEAFLEPFNADGTPIQTKDIIEVGGLNKVRIPMLPSNDSFWRVTRGWPGSNIAKFFPQGDRLEVNDPDYAFTQSDFGLALDYSVQELADEIAQSVMQKVLV